jgi:hypothetical protein
MNLNRPLSSAAWRNLDTGRYIDFGFDRRSKTLPQNLAALCRNYISCSRLQSDWRHWHKPCPSLRQEGGNEMKCQRCESDNEAGFRVLSDVLDMKVCADCAAEARQLGRSLKIVEIAKPNRERAASKTEALVTL